MGLTPRGLFSGGVITGIFFFCLMVHDGPITGGGGGGLISGVAYNRDFTVSVNGGGYFTY